jgi:MinD-like ATPase involved in chromosome partitioning or flagellar assembly
MTHEFNKVAVLNFSGNVGKSTLAKHLLAPMMPGASVVCVETINADAAFEHTIKGAEFGQLQEDMLLEDSVIVDVGSSNVEEFLALMRQYRGSHEDFDLYLVPCVPAHKQQKDTVECIRALSKLGVDAQKIRVVLNLVPPGEDVHKLFAPLIAFVQTEGLALVNTDSVVIESELFAKVRNSGQSIAEMADDQTDFKAEISRASSAQEKAALAAQLSVKRLAQGVRENLTEVYASLVSAGGWPCQTPEAKN